MKWYLFFVFILIVSVVLILTSGCRENKMMEPAQADNAVDTQTYDQPEALKENLELATFGAGCFWGVEASFRKIPGVVSTSVGYSGGNLENPTYKQVCSDRTGHAEVVQVVFDPEKVDYTALLDLFWEMHNPTTPNRQGPDIGSQYRSVIFYHNEDQQKAARESKEKLNASGKYRSEVVTQIEPAQTFYRAEDYHQQYLEKRGRSSCRAH